jgi:ribonuclease HI
LEVAPKDRKIIILSDSKYAISCVTEWFLKWREKNWMNSSNKSVENKDLIQKILEMLEERLRLNQHRMVDYDDEEIDEDGEPRGHWDRGPGSVKFVWVKGHAKDQGNNAADELAVNGARVARELGEDVELD